MKYENIFIDGHRIAEDEIIEKNLNFKLPKKSNYVEQIIKPCVLLQKVYIQVRFGRMNFNCRLGILAQQH